MPEPEKREMTQEELKRDIEVVEDLVVIGFNEAGELRMNSGLHAERLANILKQMHDFASAQCRYTRPKKVVSAPNLRDVFDPKLVNGRPH